MLLQPTGPVAVGLNLPAPLIPFGGGLQPRISGYALVCFLGLAAKSAERQKIAEKDFVLAVST